MSKKTPLEEKLEVEATVGTPAEAETAHELTEEEMAANVEAVMKKYDRESNTRIWEGAPKWVVTAILASFSLFCIYVSLFATWLEEIRLTSFVALIVLMGYIIFPAKKACRRSTVCRGMTSFDCGYFRLSVLHLLCQGHHQTGRASGAFPDHHRHHRHCGAG